MVTFTNQYAAFGSIIAFEKKSWGNVTVLRNKLDIL